MAPNPDEPMKPVVLVEDNGPIHVSKLALAALEARKHWLTVEWLPKYAPELNDIEVVWHDLKAHNLAHYTFTDAADPDRAIHQAVQALNNERSRNPLVNSKSLLRGSRPQLGRVDARHGKGYQKGRTGLSPNFDGVTCTAAGDGGTINPVREHAVVLQ